MNGAPSWNTVLSSLHILVATFFNKSFKKFHRGFISSSINCPQGTTFQQDVVVLNDTCTQQDKDERTALYQGPCPPFRVPTFVTLWWTVMMMMLRKWSDSCTMIIPTSQQHLQPPHWILSHWISSNLSLTSRGSGSLLLQSSRTRRVETIVMSERDAGS